MNKQLLDVLACPICKTELTLAQEQTDGDKILAGKLTCGSCGAGYPIEDGVPNLLPPDLRE